MQGVVKYWKDDRGYGFVRPDGACDDVFVHQTAILMSGHRSLIEGARVEFSIKVDEYGRQRAVEVRRLEEQGD